MTLNIRAITSVILLSLLTLSYAQNRQGTLVELSPVHKESKYEQIKAVGTLLPFEQVMIKPEVSGKVEAIEFTEGGDVKKGDILIRFDNRTMTAGVKEASAKRILAKQTVDRLKAAKGSSSAQQLDGAEATLLQAEAALETAEVGLDKMMLRAPFRGAVGLRNFEIGDYIQAGSSLVSLVNAEKLKLEFNLPERIAHTIKIGQSVVFTVDNFPSKNFSGDIYTISPEIEQNGRSLIVRALYDNADKQLISGMFARLSLQIPLGYEVMVVPEEAIFAAEGKQYVYRALTQERYNAEQAGKSAPLEKSSDRLIAALTEVVIGDRSSFSVEVIKGLEESDIVVKAGQIKLSDGMIIIDAAKSKVKQQSDDDKDAL